ncbi:hydroxymethylglutaryl-CoA reductase [Aspergillus tanneri]|uniref:hydroxymethylglutaryl-CoA reductase (NADPH) n=1 Tax=Aspergillus tanneri TaxID=1220188 RepID=A0A5M9N4J8_9EURO|nr:3-hydroxy-3-methylglutaryl-coenzyme A (HMG-CoA) reductase isozyme [Aspergillus tanneri]KAA8651939.1 3-hydroxy-3-methylglutaryl-coenzyme A (HMG-CoA) reductase isozyme [Aspergillus tanneri]
MCEKEVKESELGTHILDVEIIPKPAAGQFKCHSQLKSDGLIHEIDSKNNHLYESRERSLTLKNVGTNAGSPAEAVEMRREFLEKCVYKLRRANFLACLPFKNYDYFGARGCCENVIGYMPIPVGIAGPLSVDCENLYIPMATTEGALVASVSRGCKAINESGGAVTILTADAMTRAPCLQFPNVNRAYAAKLWLESSTGIHEIEKTFLATSNFAKLKNIQPILIGEHLYVRFAATTGDAMGMNIMSKCVESAVSTIKLHGFHDMRVVALSGNVCTDKKPSALNWVEGRGKSVVAQAYITHATIKRVLKTEVPDIVALNVSKNLVGSAVAGSIGGCNAHASNVISAIFAATGQDIAQVVDSCHCITTMNE